MKNLNRLFKPKSIAVIGGGSWCEAVIDQLKIWTFMDQFGPFIQAKNQSVK
jgi:acyl-CoA synthetase (NDP forming)